MQLESPATRFVGRNVELARIDSAFDGGASLVTLFGPGGAGKTRLALRFANRRADARFVDLRGARNIGEVCDLVGRELAVSLPDAGFELAIARIGAALAARGLLVILDNAEHLVDCLRPAVARWIESAPSVRLLVTSRELLGVAGEHAQDVGSLALPRCAGDVGAEAFELFLDRARLVSAQFEPSPADAAAIVDLLRALDGLPLAIELAAARVGVLGPREILGRLPMRLDLLGRVGGAADDRHRTLRATIEWSWQLLSPSDQRGLAQCSVFRDTFSVEAAEHVLDLGATGATVLDVLDSLRMKSLVQASPGRDGRVRFRLYESVRSFAQDKHVLAGEDGRTRLRHIEYFAGLATPERDGSCDDDARAEQLASALADLVAVHRAALATSPPRAEVALRVALALRDLFRIKGGMGQLAKMLDEAIAAAPATIAAGLLAVALLDRALAWRSLDPAHCPAADLERAAALAGGDPLVDGRALAVSAMLGIFRGDAQAAIEQLERARALNRRARDVIGEFDTLQRMAVWAIFDLRPGHAREHLEAALACARRVSSSSLTAFALPLLAYTLFAEGRLEEARAAIGQLRALAERLDSDCVLAYALTYEAPILQELGCWDEAEARYGRALQMHRAMHKGSNELHALINLGSLHHERGRLEKARRCYAHAIAALRDAGRRIHEGVTQAALSAVEAARDQLEPANRALDAARALLASSPRHILVSVYEGHVELAWARQRVASGDHVGAQQLQRRVRERLAALPEGGDDDVRFARRVLAAALREPRNASQPPADAWLVDLDGRWFRPPQGELVRLDDHPRLSALLGALIRQRQQQGDGTLGLADILQQVWPGERILPSAARNRVWVSIASLRKAGLRDLLTSRPGGYALDTEANVIAMSDPLA